MGSNRMKIGLVIDDTIDSNDGVQQYVRTLGSWLASQGHTVKYLAGQSHESSTVHSLAKNIRVKFNGNAFTIPFSTSGAKIRSLLKHDKYDILHIQMPYSPLLAGKIIKHADNTAVVGTFHVLPFRTLQTVGNRLLGLIQRSSLLKFSEICFVSSAARTFARQNYHIDGAVIPNMIDLSQWKHTHKVIPGRIVFLGRLVPRKGCKELLLTLAAIPEVILKKLDIIIAGDGPERKRLEALANSLGLSVTFYGYIAEAYKSQLLGSAEIAVFPSLGGESFGIVLLEAMAAGAGVVIGGNNPGYTSVLGAIPDSIIDFKFPSQAAKKMTWLLRVDKKRQEVNRAQQKLITSYDVDIVGSKIETMYTSAIAKQLPYRDNR